MEVIILLDSLGLNDENKKPAFGGYQNPSDDMNAMESSLGQSSETQRQESLQDSQDKSTVSDPKHILESLCVSVPESKRKFLLDVEGCCLPLKTSSTLQAKFEHYGGDRYPFRRIQRHL